MCLNQDIPETQTRGIVHRVALSWGLSISADIFRSIQTEDIQMAAVRFELTTFGPSL